MSGTANRLSTSPAPVTREKNDADTGRSAISMASDASTEAAIHDRIPMPRVSRPPMRTPSRRANVAPNVRMNPASRMSRGLTTIISAAATEAVCHTPLR